MTILPEAIEPGTGESASNRSTSVVRSALDCEGATVLPSRGILLVGHGTRDEQGTKQFFELAECLKAIAGLVPVEPALLEFQSPTIEEAWGKLVAVVREHIVVAPLLLFAAGHAKQDIPEIVASCQQRTPERTWSQSRPLSRHPAIIARSLETALRAIERESTNPGSTSRAYVLVGRGSHDPCAQSDTRLLAALIGYRLPVASTTTAFYAMAQPDVPTVLDQVAAQPNVQEVIVQPHLLFEGKLHQAIQRQVAEAQQRHPHVRFLMTDYLGPNQHVAQAIAQRCGVFAT